MSDSIINLISRRPILIELLWKEDLLSLLGDKMYKILHLMSSEKQNELNEYFQCLEHYNQSLQDDHIDGPPSIRKNCHYCQYNINKTI